MAISFGVTVLPDPPYTRFLELLELAEEAGLRLRLDLRLARPLAGVDPAARARRRRATSTMKLGHFVTNPGTREPTVLASAYATLHDISGGRMVMGIGRGDSARRVIGQQPVKMAEFEEACRMIRALHERRGGRVERQGARARPGRAASRGSRCTSPATARRRSRVAGRVADGVIIQLADPVIIEWIMATARKAAEQAGRDPAALQCIVGAPSKVSDDLATCREEVRWFPAMVSNHVIDLIERYGWDSDIPSELTDFVKARKFYDYKDHSRVGAAHGEFVTDEICDRFCVIGSAEACTEKLRRLEAVGVDQFNVYLMTNAQEETLAAYGRDVIPRFAGAAAA